MRMMSLLILIATVISFTTATPYHLPCTNHTLDSCVMQSRWSFWCLDDNSCRSSQNQDCKSSFTIPVSNYTMLLTLRAELSSLINTLLLLLILSSLCMPFYLIWHYQIHF